jgi:LAS superfamily LD-carboxypeptidase LdcB
MRYPVKKVVIPKQLRTVNNGFVPPNMLRKIRPGGTMWIGAVKAVNAMSRAMAAEGLTLKSVSSGYRSYASQENLFRDRYAPRPTPRKPQVTRKWNNKLWYLKVGKSPSATPGTSTHGLALAQDFNVSDPAVFEWLCKNAPRYGFFLQGKPTKLGRPNPEYEPWHWQYCLGDKTPRALK